MSARAYYRSVRAVCLALVAILLGAWGGVVHPQTLTQQQELVASDGAANDQFGYSVSISGAIAIVGAYGKTVGANVGQGAAYVFVQSGSTWTQQAELVASDGAAGDQFGYSVSLSGTAAIVGAYGKAVGAHAFQGAAYVFVQSGSTWTQQAELVSSDGAANDGFGIGVSVDGSTAAVGAYTKTIGSNMFEGAAYVFVQSGSTWTQQAELLASDGASGDGFGISVSVSGTTALVGAYTKTVGSSASQGAAYAFASSGSTWSQQAKLLASDGAAGDQFGTSVSVGGTTAVVGAYRKTVGSNASQGGAYVFVQSGTTWTQQAELVASDGAANDQLGASVSLSGTTALVGANGKTTGANANQGGAYVFAQSGSTWTQQAELLASDGASGDYFGAGVSMSGGTAFVGAWDKTVGGDASQGVAYIFAGQQTLADGGTDSGGGVDAAADSGSVSGDSGMGAQDSGGNPGDSSTAGNDSGSAGPDSSVASDATTEASDDGGNNAAPGQPSGCGCRTAPRQGVASYAFLGLGVLIAVGMRRLRRRSGPHR